MPKPMWSSAAVGTGLTAGDLLAKAGKRVIILERGRCAATDTGHTSAHLTMVTDTRLSELVKEVGRTHAQAVWDAGLAAIAKIDDIVREYDIDAGFEWVDGYVHAPLGDDATDQPEQLKSDANLAGELGFDAEYLESVPLVGRPGVRFAITPASIASVSRGRGEGVRGIRGPNPRALGSRGILRRPTPCKANGHAVTCEDVVIATHNPVVGLAAGLAPPCQTKLALYTSYVMLGMSRAVSCPTHSGGTRLTPTSSFASSRTGAMTW
jgi:glycine/D-amino acid oxidase-like deaminating enzyme